MEATTAVIVAAAIAAVGSTASPLLLNYLNTRNRRVERAEDFARQDAVAAEVRKVRVQAEEAARHAATASEVVVGMAADMKELAVNTNSIQEKLNITMREAGHLEGRAEARAEAAAKK